MEFTDRVMMDQVMKNIQNDPEELSQWDCLPLHILLKIYLNLDKYDQCLMSMVSSNWAELFDDPQLWRRITFPLFRTATRQNVESLFMEEDLIENFGHMVKHLTVRDFYSCKGRTKLMKNLEILSTKTQLESFTLEQSNGNIIANLDISLLKMQNNLQSVEIRDCKLNFFHANLICWCIYGKKHLKTFKMNNIKWNKDIFSSVGRDERFATLWESFLQIEDVEISDSARMWELLLYGFQHFVKFHRGFEELKKRKSGVKLKTLKMSYCINNEFKARNKSAIPWIEIALACPELTVTVEISAECKKIEDMASILPPPTVLRKIAVENREKKGESLKCFLNHLLNEGYNKTLEEIKITWRLEDGDSSLFKDFIRKCPKMKTEKISNC